MYTTWTLWLWIKQVDTEFRSREFRDVCFREPRLRGSTKWDSYFSVFTSSWYFISHIQVVQVVGYLCLLCLCPPYLTLTIISFYFTYFISHYILTFCQLSSRTIRRRRLGRDFMSHAFILFSFSPTFVSFYTFIFVVVKRKRLNKL